ncbi:MAG: zinc-dependent alcohol dehydrogenase family protein [Acidimicrobiia bacterium]|nr:zinc-dependent alcohol dehydrogenase family protein [Acidimicrobiia bacterium]
MRAWWVERPAPIAEGPLRFGERPDPEPGPGQVRVRVRACAVCRTDLHVVEGDLDVHRPHVVPGHEVVGVIEAVGDGVDAARVGQRVGVAWVGRTCGVCRYCRRGDENLCAEPTFTGWDTDGGYAEAVVADAGFVHPLPDGPSDEQLAPLLCAGIIGYRALRRCDLPPGGRLGIYGFGGSAHLTAQVALWEGATVHVCTRSAEAQALALELGCASAQGAADPPPEPLDAAILFAPVGELVPSALAALDRGGILAIAGIHLSDLPSMPYAALFEERQIRSVTANTRTDAAELLALAAEIPLRSTVVTYPFEHADRALADLAADRFAGAAVLQM